MVLMTPHLLLSQYQKKTTTTITKKRSFIHYTLHYISLQLCDLNYFFFIYLLNIIKSIIRNLTVLFIYLCERVLSQEIYLFICFLNSHLRSFKKKIFKKKLNNHFQFFLSLISCLNKLADFNQIKTEGNIFDSYYLKHV